MIGNGTIFHFMARRFSVFFGEEKCPAAAKK
jgi:hypothetical protein